MFLCVLNICSTLGTKSGLNRGSGAYYFFLYFKGTYQAVFTRARNVLPPAASIRFSSACLSDVEVLFDGEDDVFDLRQAVVLQDFGVRHGDVDTRDSGDRRVKVIEGRTCVGVK